ncbi:MAG: DUF2971 domain-containing protein [Pseudomonadota bacterium]
MTNQLYKFVGTTEAVENLIQGHLKFTTILDLNDPNEMFSGCDKDSVEISKIKIRKTGYSDEQFKWLKHQEHMMQRLVPKMKFIKVPKTPKEATEYLRKEIYDNKNSLFEYQKNVVTKMHEKVGILSLSDSFDIIPLWAHYARNRAGFAVIFDNLDKAFLGDDTGSLNIIKPVEYLDELTGMTFDPTTQDRLFFSKRSAWSYEREWRVVLPLSACHKKPPSLYIKTIDKSYISGVIFGDQTSESDRNVVINAVNELNPRIKLFNAIISQQGHVVAHPINPH